MDNNINIRNIVLNMLALTIDEGQFSHMVLNGIFEKYSLKSQDKAFLNRLYMGVLEKLVFLDYVIDRYSTTPIKKMKPVIRNILRMSLYQMVFMDSVPNRAAIDEAVKLAKKRGFVNLSGFVNGVLRNIEREQTLSGFPEYVNFSVPEWMYNIVKGQYGEKKAGCFFDAIGKVSTDTTVRFNLLKAAEDITGKKIDCKESKAIEENIAKSLEDEGCKVRKLEGRAMAISGFESLTKLRAFKNGWIIMQDIASMKVAEAAAAFARNPKLMADVCAAPGGKSMYLAELFPEAEVISRDLTEHKAALIKENIKRLGAHNVIPQVFDATVFDKTLAGKCDVVVADVPCSGLGVIGHKPDIINRLKPEDLTDLAALQSKILATVSGYVKPQGILVYSTCTINKGENEENVNHFLKNGGSDFEKIFEKQYLPGLDDCDGFYIAVLKRNR